MPATPQERRHRVCPANRKTLPSIILGTSVLTFGLLGAGVTVVTATPIPPLANTPVQDAHCNGVGTADVAHQFSSAPTPSQELHWPQTRPVGATQSGVVVQRAVKGNPRRRSHRISAPVVPSTSHADTTSPATVRKRFQNPSLDTGYMVTRAPRAGETLTAILDDWVNECDASSPETLRQNSRLRMGTGGGPPTTPRLPRRISLSVRSTGAELGAGDGQSRRR